MTNCWSKVVGPVNWFSQQAGDDGDDDADNGDDDDDDDEDDDKLLEQSCWAGELV